MSLVQQLGSEKHRCSVMTAVLRSTAAGSEALSSRRQLPDQRLILLAAAIYDCSPLCSGALFFFLCIKRFASCWSLPQLCSEPGRVCHFQHFRSLNGSGSEQGPAIRSQSTQIISIISRPLFRTANHLRCHH